MGRINADVVKKYLPYVVGLLAFVYFTVLSAKQFTWVLTSGDSGDWLTAASTWFIPQPYGAPLYVLLSRLIYLTPFGSLVVKLTLLLSCLPSAITVTVTYVIINKMTDNWRYALTASLVLCGAAVFLAQSTTLLVYPLAAMFLSLALLFYVQDRKYWSAIMLACGVCVHVLLIGMLLVLLVVERRNYFRPLLLTAGIVAITYLSFLSVLMTLDTPRLLAGSLSIESLKRYVFDTAGATLGSLSIFEAPKRLLLTCGILLGSFGLALIPLWYTIKQGRNKLIALLLGMTAWSLWFWITDIDQQAWHHLSLLAVPVALLGGLGLQHVSLSWKFVAVGAVVLISVNCVFMNANVLAKAEPLATTYESELLALPNGSAVIVDDGTHALALFYVMVERNDLVPIVSYQLDAHNAPSYVTWLNDKYGLRINDVQNTLGAVDGLLNSDREVFWVETPNKAYSECYETVGKSSMIQQVTSLTGAQPKSYIEWTKQ